METKRFIIGGRAIEIVALGKDIDKAFIALHAAYFGHQALDWAEFETTAAQFLDANPKPSDIHNAYFNNFTIIWRNFLSSGNFDEAERVWDMALSPVLKWEEVHPGQRAHKGTAYYFWGMTALQRGDLDKGYVLMHQAVEEDVLTMGQAVPDTPALALATLNYAKADQAFKQWVNQQASFLNRGLNHYSAKYVRPFILDDFRNSFLLKPPNIDVVFLLAFAVARLMKITTLPPHSLKSRFAGQLEANVFFDIALVIDSMIHAKNPNDKWFIDHAKYLLAAAGQPITLKFLQDANAAFNADFNAALIGCLDGLPLAPSGIVLTGLQADVGLAYGIRNRCAHDVTSSPAIWERFTDAYQALMNVMFAAVDYLY